MQFENTDLSEVHGVVARGALGDSYSVAIPEGAASHADMRNAVANFIVYLSGSVKVTYERYPGSEQMRSAGQTSFDSDWSHPNPGNVTFTVTTPEFSYLCLRRYGSVRLAPVVTKAKAGDAITIPANTNAVIATGSVVVSGVTVNGLGQVLVGANAANVQVASDATIVFVDRP
jgi:hypothetical protein